MANPVSKYKEDIKRLKKQGYRNIDIANELGCTKSTVAYHLNDSTKNYARDRSRERRKRTKEWFREYTKNHCCTVCFESESICLDYHHIFPEDKFKEVSSMVNEMFSKEKILAEMKKCICVCSNCHRKIHAELIDIQDYI